VNAWRFDPAKDVSLSESVKTWINVDKPSLGSMHIKHDVGATKEEAIARTQLATAAPKLLAALEDLHAQPEVRAAAPIASERARAAIKAAKGGA
jgi:hypothetical protein